MFSTIRATSRFARPSSTPLVSAFRPFTISSVRSSTQGYGDGKGDPKAEDPQGQGESNATKENAEHPGPEAPASGSSKPGSGGNSPESASAQSGGSRSKEAKETGSSPTGGSVGGGKRSFSTLANRRAFSTSLRWKKDDIPSNGAKPALYKQGSGEGNSDAKAKEVEQHNKEFENRSGKDKPKQDDKVDKKFWSGEGNIDAGKTQIKD